MPSAVSKPFTIQVVTRSSLPSWVPQPGRFAEFTLNTMNDARPVNYTDSILANWCGAAYIRDYSANGGIAYHGGGEHSNWPDRGGVVVLDLSTRRYEWVCAPANTSHVGAASAGVGSPVGGYGEYLDDGSPQSKHTYNGLCEMPAAWGGGPRGSLIRAPHTGGLTNAAPPFGSTSDPFTTQGYAGTWRFDLSKGSHSVRNPAIFNMTAGQYFNHDPGTPGYKSVANSGVGSCMDEIRQGFWTGEAFPNGSGWCFVTKAGIIYRTLSPGTPPGGLGRGFFQPYHFADTDELICFTDWNGPRIYVGKPVGNPPTGFSSWANAAIRFSPSSIENEFNCVAFDYHGPKWSSILGCFVCIQPYNSNPPPTGIGLAQPSLTVVSVFKITPPPAGQRQTGTWVITKESLTSADGSVMRLDSARNPDSANQNGSYGKLLEAPRLRSLVWTRNASDKGQLLRLTGM